VPSLYKPELAIESPSREKFGVIEVFSGIAISYKATNERRGLFREIFL